MYWFYEYTSVQVMLGGIFPFDTVMIYLRYAGGDYKVYPFDGSKYYIIAEGKAIDYQIKLSLPRTITSSYQIKIEYSKTFSSEPEIAVM